MIEEEKVKTSLRNINLGHMLNKWAFMVSSGYLGWIKNGANSLPLCLHQDVDPFSLNLGGL